MKKDGRGYLDKKFHIDVLGNRIVPVLVPDMMLIDINTLKIRTCALNDGWMDEGVDRELEDPRYHFEVHVGDHPGTAQPLDVAGRDITGDSAVHQRRDRTEPRQSHEVQQDVGR